MTGAREVGILTLTVAELHLHEAADAVEVSRA